MPEKIKKKKDNKLSSQRIEEKLFKAADKLRKN